MPENGLRGDDPLRFGKSGHLAQIMGLTGCRVAVQFDETANPPCWFGMSGSSSRRRQQARNGCPCGRPIRTGMTDNVRESLSRWGVCGTSRLKPTEHQETLSRGSKGARFPVQHGSTGRSPLAVTCEQSSRQGTLHTRHSRSTGRLSFRIGCRTSPVGRPGNGTMQQHTVTPVRGRSGL